MTRENPLIRHYQERLARHGPSPQAVQYADTATQYARFAVLYEVDPEMHSVLDYGCGLADFCHFLRQQGNQARYRGLEQVPEFVELSNSALATDPLAEVHLADIVNDAPPQGYEYAVLSGVFNNRMDDNWGFMTAVLERMFAACTKGIAFNAMTTFVDYEDDGLYYADPFEVLRFCKLELGGHPVLRHDYALRSGGFPFEYAIYLYKEPRCAGR